MKTNDKTTNVAISLLLRVELSTGKVKEHIYLLPEKQNEALKKMDPIIESIGTALFEGKGFIHLENPSITYNAEHVVYIEAIFRGPAEWQEVIKKSTKLPLGFRPVKPSEQKLP